MLVKLTTPTGRPVWISDTWVMRIMASPVGNVGRTEITLSGTVQYVEESPEEVARQFGQSL